MTFEERVFSIFRQLNAIPRSSHHEEKVADFLCDYAKGLGLDYDRDAENCVVIRKGASPGHEGAETIVLLNHMDMVAVGDGSRPFDPLNDGIEAYVEDGWMKARGTSLGADNGIGLSMALAVLADESLIHGPLEVFTTTNEEDGMSGAASVSPDFVKGRKVINLDSEDYDTITVGAAGAYLQTALFPAAPRPVPADATFLKVSISGGAGGHSGVDIGKGRINANRELARMLCASAGELWLVSIDGGSANASIASACTAVVGVRDASDFRAKFEKAFMETKETFTDGISLLMAIEAADPADAVADEGLLKLIASLPCGVIRMHETLPGTVMTSNNIGRITTGPEGITVSCHTRSFSDSEMVATAEAISEEFRNGGASVNVIMNTPGWQEDPDSEYMELTDSTFRDVLGFSPRKVAMHFVLEAGYYVQKFPGIQIACIGPRIVEPHSTGERVELSTVSDICRILVEMLRRLA